MMNSVPVDMPLMAQTGEVTFGLIKSEAVGKGHTGTILDTVLAVPLGILCAYRTRLSADQILDLFGEQRRKPDWRHLVESVSEDVVVLAICGRNALKTWQALLGPSDPAVAPRTTLRGRYGNFEVPAHNVAHASETHGQARREIQLFFPALIRLHDR